MSLGQKLINRLGAQARKVKRLAPSFEKINEQTAVLARATGSQKLILSAQRQTDQSGIGEAVLAQKIEVAKVLALSAALAMVAEGGQDIKTIADTGVAQHQSITAVADVAGSLNSTWFSISSINAISKLRKDWYVWFDKGSGAVDPAPVGRTGIHITYSPNASASTLGGLIASALAALTNDWSSAVNTSGTVAIVNAKPGAVPAAADGTAPTGFTFTAPSVLGVNSNLNNKYFLINSGSNTRMYYVWLNVASLGTDPAVGGKTAIPVAIAASASANAVATAVGAAIAAAHSSGDFSTIVTTNDVAVTNLDSGPYTAPSDFNTGFTISGASANLQATISNSNLGNNVESLLQIQAGDLAEVLSGQLEGNFYTIASITNNVIEFEESVAGYAGEASMSLRFSMRSTKPQILSSKEA